MKNNVTWIILVVVVLVALGGVLWWQNSKKNIMPGSDRDEHGCIGSAGYVWCESSQKCLREWEEQCESNVVAPKYLSQMDECRAMGATVEEQEKDMGGWTQIDKWKCTCSEGETFSSDNLECNIWLDPAI